MEEMSGVEEIVMYAALMAFAAFLLSPMNTVVTILVNKSLGHFRADSYVAALLNYGFMIMFGIVRPSQLLTFIGIVGFVVEMIYVGIFILYASNDEKKKIVYCICAGVTCFATYSLVVMFVAHHHHTRKVAFGVISVVVNILMYGFPGVVTIRVMESENVNTSSVSVAVATFLNCCVWVVYSVISHNSYQMVSNAVGVLLGLLQFLIYCYYTPTLNPVTPAMPGADAIAGVAPAVVMV